MELQKCWYQNKVVLWPLIPFSFLYSCIIKLRKKLYDIGIFSKQSFEVPVIVVGNITVGGTGKTPLVIYIAELLKKHGLKPGIVSRGYKGSHLEPSFVTENSNPNDVGDEAIVIVKRTQCPMIVAKNRCLGIKKLLLNNTINIVITDDGLQHYALARQIEIAVVDGKRRFGNQYLLPVGPLREPISRLNSVDIVVVNNGAANLAEYEMYYEPQLLIQAIQPIQQQMLHSLVDKKVHAVTGLGNPEQFFELLRKHGLKVITHQYPDHYVFKKQDICFEDGLPVILTEKDAVKCQYFFESQHWILPIRAALSPSFDDKLIDLIQGN